MLITLRGTKYVFDLIFYFLFFLQNKKLVHVITNNCVTTTNRGYPVMEPCVDKPEQIWEITLNDLSKITTKKLA